MPGGSENSKRGPRSRQALPPSSAGGGAYRWFIVALFFAFMLFHQSDKLLIGSLTDRIQATFGITKTQMGAVSTGALIVGSILYPVWGYLYDRYARSKLLALASFIWGTTTCLNALAPTYRAFLLTRASTGIDDSSYPGLYSLVADYFEPRLRGRVYGLLQLTAPLGFLAGMVLAITLGPRIGWRNVFLLTGSLGIAIAIAIFFGVREAPRGRSEPELADLAQIGAYRFSWEAARGLFRKRSLILLFVQGFFGVFPWNVITYWFMYYLKVERGYGDSPMLLLTMGLAVLALAAGYPVAGALGDRLFRRTPRGRILVAGSGVITGAILLMVTLSVPAENAWLFLGLLCLTAFVIPFAAPNVIATVYDVTEPEVRSTALAVQYFIESAGAALSPLLAGIIADRWSLHIAILGICVTAWLLCAIFFAFVGYLVPRDVSALRQEMRRRADLERARSPAA
ncbi:MAG: MFS transporter [Chloroflexia bacterium]